MKCLRTLLSLCRIVAKMVHFSQDLVAFLRVKSSKRQPTLDLHGYKTDEVFDAVEEFLRKHQNEHTVRIMPGKGTGKVKSVVIDYLGKAKYPWSYEKLPNGQTNDGVLVVYMQ
jgi:dsDNA-specific endonuclease/ATPase MutS2